jgi:hypothetical protein
MSIKETIKLVLLHNSISKNTDFINSLQKEKLIIYYVNNDTNIDELYEYINKYNISHLTFIYHYPGYLRIPFFDNNIIDVSGGLIREKYLYMNDNIVQLIKNINNSNLIVDLLSCNLNTDSFKNEIDKIENDLNINIRYSLDQTGNNPQGNWVLESDDVNIKDIYFTEDINNWNGVLNSGRIISSNNDYFDISGNTIKLKNNFIWSVITSNLGWNTTDFIQLQANQVFDGQGYSIDLDGISNWYGLFSTSGTSIETGSIVKNLGILNGTLVNNGGYIIRTEQKFFTVNNCYSTGIINGEGSGGIVGFKCSNNNGYLKVEKCYSIGDITGLYAGGIVGADSVWYGGTCEINDCYSNGNIDGDNTGGIIGNAAAAFSTNSICNINNCYSSGSITNTTNTGGITALNPGYDGATCNVTNCYSARRSGNITNGSSVGSTPMDGNYDISILSSTNIGELGSAYGPSDMYIYTDNIVYEYPVLLSNLHYTIIDILLLVEDVSITIQQNEDFILNDIFVSTKPNDVTLEYEIYIDSSNGRVDISGNTFTYIPNNEFYGNDTLKYRSYNVDNPIEKSIPGTINIYIDSNPFVQPLNIDVSYNSLLEKTITLVGEDLEYDGDLSFSIIDQPTKGTLTKISEDTYTYIPFNNTFGSDIFTYKAYHETQESSLGTITVNIVIDENAEFTIIGFKDNNELLVTMRYNAAITDSQEITKLIIDISNSEYENNYIVDISKVENIIDISGVIEGNNNISFTYLDNSDNILIEKSKVYNISNTISTLSVKDYSSIYNIIETTDLLTTNTWNTNKATLTINNGVYEVVGDTYTLSHTTPDGGIYIDKNISGDFILEVDFETQLINDSDIVQAGIILNKNNSNKLVFLYLDDVAGTGDSNNQHISTTTSVNGITLRSDLDQATIKLRLTRTGDNVECYYNVTDIATNTIFENTINQTITGIIERIDLMATRFQTYNTKKVLYKSLNLTGTQELINLKHNLISYNDSIVNLSIPITPNDNLIEYTNGDIILTDTSTNEIKTIEFNEESVVDISINLGIYDVSINLYNNDYKIGNTTNSELFIRNEDIQLIYKNPFESLDINTIYNDDNVVIISLIMGIKESVNQNSIEINYVSRNDVSNNKQRILVDDSKLIKINEVLNYDEYDIEIKLIKEDDYIVYPEYLIEKDLRLSSVNIDSKDIIEKKIDTYNEYTIIEGTEDALFNGTKIEELTLISTGETFIERTHNVYRLTKDIDINDINGFSNSYRIDLKKNHIFNGDKHTIDLVNTQIDGLFTAYGDSIESGPLIENLGIINGGILSHGDSYFIKDNGSSYFKINNCYSTGPIDKNRSGGIISSNCGRNSMCIISNCYSTGNIDNESGGIAGGYSGNSGICIIKNCYSTGNIDTSSGGITGKHAGGPDGGSGVNSGLCIIDNCYSVGNITGSQAGGIVGSYAYHCIVNNCYSLGEITGYIAGGITGSNAYVSSSITNCYSNNSNNTGGTINGNGSNFLDGNYHISLLENVDPTEINDISLNTSSADVSGNAYIVLETSTYPLLKVFREDVWDRSAYTTYDSSAQFGDYYKLIEKYNYYNDTEGNVDIVLDVINEYISYSRLILELSGNDIDNSYNYVFSNSDSQIVINENLEYGKYEAKVSLYVDDDGQEYEIGNTINTILLNSKDRFIKEVNDIEPCVAEFTTSYRTDTTVNVIVDISMNSDIEYKEKLEVVYKKINTNIDTRLTNGDFNLPPSTQIYYTMDNNNSIIGALSADTIINNVGNPTSVAGIKGEGLETGINKYINLNFPNIDINNYTFMVWCNITYAGEYSSPFYYRNDSDGTTLGMEIYPTSGTNYLTSRADKISIRDNRSFRSMFNISIDDIKDRWVHLCMAVDRQAKKSYLYIDGELIEQVDGPFIDDTLNINHINIGADPYNASARYTDAVYDQFGFFTEALDSYTVKKIYQASTETYTDIVYDVEEYYKSIEPKEISRTTLLNPSGLERINKQLPYGNYEIGVYTTYNDNISSKVVTIDKDYTKETIEADLKDVISNQLEPNVIITGTGDAILGSTKLEDLTLNSTGEKFIIRDENVYKLTRDINWTDITQVYNNSNSYYITLLDNHIFDGNGYTIDLQSNSTKGLFVLNGTSIDTSSIVKNLGILNGVNNGTGSGYLVRSYTSDYVKLYNCYVTGNVSRDQAGALLGSYSCRKGEAHIKGCYTSGNMTSGNRVGYFCGQGSFNGGTFSKDKLCLIEDCYSLGDINSNNGNDSTSGMFARHSFYNTIAHIRNCYVYGRHTNSAGGGFLAIQTLSNGYCVIQNCVAFGDITNSNANSISNHTVYGTLVVQNCYGNNASGTYPNVDTLVKQTDTGKSTYGCNYSLSKLTENSLDNLNKESVYTLNIDGTDITFSSIGSAYKSNYTVDGQRPLLKYYLTNIWKDTYRDVNSTPTVKENTESIYDILDSYNYYNDTEGNTRLIFNIIDEFSYYSSGVLKLFGNDIDSSYSIVFSNNGNEVILNETLKYGEYKAYLSIYKELDGVNYNIGKTTVFDLIISKENLVNDINKKLIDVKFTTSYRTDTFVNIIVDISLDTSIEYKDKLEIVYKNIDTSNVLTNTLLNPTRLDKINKELPYGNYEILVYTTYNDYISSKVVTIDKDFNEETITKEIDYVLKNYNLFGINDIIIKDTFNVSWNNIKLEELVLISSGLPFIEKKDNIYNLLQDIKVSDISGNTNNDFYHIFMYDNTVFNGNGYTIDLENMNISKSSGMFVTKASSFDVCPIIRNLGLLNGKLSIYSGYFNGAWAEGVSGDPNYIRIYDCYSTGPMTGYGGGICGIRAGTNGGKVHIKGCYSVGDITGSTSGGICGQAAGVSGSVLIENCYSLGNINHTNGSVGGISGAHYNNNTGVDLTIKNCYSYGDVISGYGICALDRNDVYIQNCYCKSGNISPTNPNLINCYSSSGVVGNKNHNNISELSVSSLGSLNDPVTDFGNEDNDGEAYILDNNSQYPLLKQFTQGVWDKSVYINADISSNYNKIDDIVIKYNYYNDREVYSDISFTLLEKYNNYTSGLLELSGNDVDVSYNIEFSNNGINIILPETLLYGNYKGKVTLYEDISGINYLVGNRVEPEIDIQNGDTIKYLENIDPCIIDITTSSNTVEGTKIQLDISINDNIVYKDKLEIVYVNKDTKEELNTIITDVSGSYTIDKLLPYGNYEISVFTTYNSYISSNIIIINKDYSLDTLQSKLIPIIEEIIDIEVIEGTGDASFNNIKLEELTLISTGETFIERNNNIYILTRDIEITDISGYSNSYHFSLLENHVFYGKGHTIDLVDMSVNGLFITRGTSIDNAPLIEKLGILNGNLSGDRQGYFIKYQGSNYLKINNCYSTGPLYTYRYTGGIVGSEIGKKSMCIISNCYSTGTIDRGSGGIVGAYSADNGICIIENCYSTGDIKQDCGGIAGYYCGYTKGKCIINNCYSTGDIIGNYGGGIVGTHTGRRNGYCMINNCYSTGDIIGSYSGGIASYGFSYKEWYESESSYGPSSIHNCYSKVGDGRNGNNINISGQYAYDGNYNITELENVDSSTIDSIPLNSSSTDVSGNAYIVLETSIYPLLKVFRELNWDKSKYISYDNKALHEPIFDILSAYQYYNDNEVKIKFELDILNIYNDYSKGILDLSGIDIDEKYTIEFSNNGIYIELKEKIKYGNYYVNIELLKEIDGLYYIIGKNAKKYITVNITDVENSIEKVYDSVIIKANSYNDNLVYIDFSIDLNYEYYDINKGLLQISDGTYVEDISFNMDLSGINTTTILLERNKVYDISLGFLIEEGYKTNSIYSTKLDVENKIYEISSVIKNNIVFISGTEDVTVSGSGKKLEELTLQDGSRFITKKLNVYTLEKTIDWDTNINGINSVDDYIILPENTIFNGNNNTINIKNNNTYYGLFTTICQSKENSPYIRNLSITSNSSSTSLNGILMKGQVKYIRVNNCKFSGSITGNNRGVIAGSKVGIGGYIEVRNCIFLYNDITGSYGGGIIGSEFGYQDETSELLIENCYVKGNIGYEAGGILGNHSYGKVVINNCYTKIKINNRDSGGLIGAYCGKSDIPVYIKNCYTIVDNTSKHPHVGGLLGYNPKNVIVQNCYNKITNTNIYTSSLIGWPKTYEHRYIQNVYGNSEGYVSNTSSTDLTNIKDQKILGNYNLDLLENGELHELNNSNTYTYNGVDYVNEGNAYVADTTYPVGYPLLKVFTSDEWELNTYDDYDDVINNNISSEKISVKYISNNRNIAYINISFTIDNIYSDYDTIIVEINGVNIKSLKYRKEIDNVGLDVSFNYSIVEETYEFTIKLLKDDFILGGTITETKILNRYSLNRSVNTINGGLLMNIEINDNNELYDSISDYNYGSIITTEDVPENTIGYSIDATLSNNISYSHNTITDLPSGYTNNFTYSTWVKTTKVNSDYRGFMYTGSNTGFLLVNKTTNNELRFNVGNSYWSTSTGVYLEPNIWYYVTATISPTETKIFVNGQLEYKRSATRSGYLTGSNFFSGNSKLDGYLNSMRIYNRALTDQEVLALYNLYKLGNINEFISNLIVRDVNWNIKQDISSNLILESTNPNQVTTDFEIYSEPSNGIVQLSNNKIIYTPNKDYYGYDNILYNSIEVDSEEKSNIGIISITVNVKPIINDISVDVSLNNSITIELSGNDLLNEDLSYVIVSQPTKGILGDISGNKILYTLNYNEVGKDSFNYKVVDSLYETIQATVSININIPININSETYSYSENVINKLISYDVDLYTYPDTTKVLFEIPEKDMIFLEDISGIQNKILLTDLSYGEIGLNVYFLDNNSYVLKTINTNLIINNEDLITTLSNVNINTIKFNSSLTKILSNISINSKYNYYDYITIELTSTTTDKKYIFYIK